MFAPAAFRSETARREPGGPGPAPFDTALAGAPEGTRAVFLRAETARIRVALTPPGPRGLALVLPGRTEYAEKYGEVMNRLAGLGLGAVVIDWRGQGRSDRPDGATGLGHVGDFAEYQEDLAALLALPEISARPGPRVMFAHSMGGCIGLRALMRGLGLQGAVFSAPMWGLALAPWQATLARALAWAGTRLGLATQHAPGEGPGFYVERTPFAGNQLTTDRAQYERMIAQLARHPELGLGGPGLGWLDTAFAEMAALARAPMPRLPVLGLLGTGETIVSSDAIRGQIARMPDARLVELDGARHEIWMEAAPIRDRAWAETSAFLDRIGV